MTTSLTTQINDALKKRSSWSIERLKSALSQMKLRFPEAVIDWEEGNENWARLLYGDYVVVLINALIPLAIIRSNHCDEFRSILSDCQIISVESFTTEDYSVDKDLLEHIVDRKVSENVNYSSLSIDDLWWATV